MAIPDFQSTMRPLLTTIADGQIHMFNSVCDSLYSEFQLTEEEKLERLPSGKQTVIRNRIAWARTYLKKAGLLNAPGRSQLQITERGLKAIEECPEKVNVKYLKQFEAFLAFHTSKKKAQPSAAVVSDGTSTSDDELTITPEEQIEGAYSSLRESLASDLLDIIKSQTPTFFEQLVVDLMLKMGYGGSREEAGRATQQSADGGIDGVIHEDRLGLDTIYLQAKRWESTVGRPEIQKFAGALQGEGATKGVFITTSDYSSGARENARNPLI
ncbi:restriction endonuclease, partial [Sansalvadorimonas verongulae]|uniref:restriction endonuclease n=1 Tax=Sansalvadorimonas verongulae TaxID=2172824 RepID=UPI0012BBE964